MRERPYKTCVALKDIGSCKINKKIAKKKPISDTIDRIISYHQIFNEKRISGQKSKDFNENLCLKKRRRGDRKMEKQKSY